MFFEDFYGFWDVGNNFLFAVESVKKISEKKSTDFYYLRKNFPGFFCEPPKLFLDLKKKPAVPKTKKLCSG